MKKALLERYENARDSLRDLAALDSKSEIELHRMAERLDGLMRIARAGHHVACGTAFGRACDCNGHISEGGLPPKGRAA